MRPIAMLVSALIVLFTTGTDTATATATTLSFSSAFDLAWTNAPTSTLPWNSMTTLIDFSMLTSANRDGTINTTAHGLTPAHMQGDVTAAHQHGKRALISIGGAEDQNWDAACNSTNRAKFAANLVSVVKTYGYDGVDLDIEQDFGYPSYPDYTPCVAGIRSALKAYATNSILTEDGDPSWQGYMISHVAQYVDYIQLMSYWGTASQMPAEVASYTGQGVPVNQLVIGLGTDPGDPTQADLTPTDVVAKIQYVLANGLGGIMNWFVTTTTPGTDAIASYLSGSSASYCTSATLTSDKTSPQPGGTTVTFTGLGAGPGCANPLYEFWTWSAAGGWQMRQGYSVNAQLVLSTTGMAPGAYTVDVWVEESGSVLGTGSYETFGLASWVVGGCDSASLTLNPAPTTGIYTFTASVGGAGCATPLYQWWVYSVAGGWQMKQAYNPTNTWQLNADTLANGTYTVDVWVKQQGSPLQYETWALSTIPKGACGSNATTAITPTQLSPQAVGGAIHLTTVSTCGATPSYRYWTYPGPSNGWQMLSDYSTTGSDDWNTTGYKPGTQSLVVHVLHQAPTSSNLAPDTWGVLSYSLLGCSSATLSGSPASPQARSAGSILFSATAGTCGTPQYKFWYLRPGGSWIVAQDWSSMATYTWNPTTFAPGTYAWVVYVRQQGSANAYDSYALNSYTLT